MYRALLVAVLAVLAGCGGAPAGEQTRTETVTAAPVPTESPDAYSPGVGTRTATDTPGALPPGVSAEGVDPQAVAAAMRTALRGTAYEWTLDELEAREASALRATYAGPRVHAEVAGPARYVLDYSTVIEPGDGGERTTPASARYVDGSRILNHDGTAVTVRPVSSAHLGYPSRVAANVAGYLAAERVAVTSFRNGSAYVRGEGSNRPGRSAYSVAALVGPEGTIRTLDASFTRDGRERTVRFRLDRGIRFDPPAWSRGTNVTVTR